MLDDLRDALTSFDWWYEMSDDGRVWRNGCAADDRLQALIKRCAAEDRAGTLEVLRNHRHIPDEKRPFYIGVAG